MQTTPTDYLKLPLSDRIQLVEDLWDSIAEEASDTFSLSPEQKAELSRRLAAHKADPSSAVSWEHVRRKLFQR